MNDTESKIDSRAGRLKFEIIMLSAILVVFVSAAIIPFRIEGYLSLLSKGNIYALLVMMGITGVLLTMLQRLGILYTDQLQN